MQLTYLLTTAFAASALGATFNHFQDKSCQNGVGVYVDLTAAEQQAIIEEKYASSASTEQASGFLSSPDDRRRCPSNSDDTYKWVSIPQWAGEGGGGAIAVVYYKETDTYNACRYLAASQWGSYAGSCK